MFWTNVEFLLAMFPRKPVDLMLLVCVLAYESFSRIIVINKVFVLCNLFVSVWCLILSVF